MADKTLEQVWQDAQALPEEDRERLRDRLADEPPTTRPRTEKEILDELDRRLLAKGIISRIPPPIADPESYRRYKPIEVKGKPVSETLIEERR